MIKHSLLGCGSQRRSFSPHVYSKDTLTSKQTLMSAVVVCLVLSVTWLRRRFHSEYMLHIPSRDLHSCQIIMLCFFCCFWGFFYQSFFFAESEDFELNNSRPGVLRTQEMRIEFQHCKYEFKMLIVECGHIPNIFSWSICWLGQFWKERGGEESVRVAYLPPLQMFYFQR